MQDVWDTARPEWLVWVATRNGVLTEKEQRLFACWAVRQVWHFLADERSRKAVEVSERFANGEASKDELAAANSAADAAAYAAWAAASDAARAAAWAAASDAARAAASDEAWAAASDAAWAAASDEAWAAASDAAWAAAWAAASDAARAVQAAYLRKLTPNFNRE